MSDITRKVYVISDLHLGGVYPTPGDPTSRGFRICTHAPAIAEFVRGLIKNAPEGVTIELVVNGDMVDFLAEAGHGDEEWVPFIPDPDRAIETLRAITGRDQEVFDAFGAFLEAGHRMVTLLGNHDVELCFPGVRAALKEIIGVKGHHDFEFILDGEAYLVGDALIEHGNEYDDWNRVNYAQLRKLRSRYSRLVTEEDDEIFEPPAGSHMVSDVINPIKEHYGFIDLLKPQNGAALPMLVALEPGCRKKLGRIAGIVGGMKTLGIRKVIATAIGADISSDGPDIEDFGGEMGGMGNLGEDMGGSTPPEQSEPEPEPEEPDHLAGHLMHVLGEAAEKFTEIVEATIEHDEADEIGSDISAMDTINTAWGMAKMALSSSDEKVEARLPALLQAMRALRDDHSFDESVETGKDYIEAAQAMARGPIKHVVFGHTHLPKKVKLESGGYYLNSGTWANVLHFPEEIIKGDEDIALPKLREFVEAMKENDFSQWCLFRPTYVRLDVGSDGVVVEAALVHHEVSATVSA